VKKGRILMADYNVQTNGNSNPDNAKTEKSPFAQKFVKTGIPLLAIAICVVIISFLATDAFKNANNIEGKFVKVGGSEAEFIELNPDGEYTFSNGEEKEKGSWKLADGKFTFDSTGTNTFEGVMIQSKYMAIKDEDFLKGEVPVGNKFTEASVETADGKIYLFDSEGNFSRVEDGRNTKIGNYITDGNFIVVTIGEETITYLNCSDGITAVYYQIV
jgi:hypothetical protein